MLKVLLTGVNGQLGTHICELISGYSTAELILRTREEIDLSKINTVKELILADKPDVVINASAYTNVDKAETDRELAMTINGTAVGEIAKACEELGASLIQVSTDYVFDGEKKGSYLPNDPTNPINYYGETKLRGEQLALKYCNRAVIVRSSWVHSTVGKNFETTMRRLFKEKEELRVISDQRGRPTHASLLAKYCLDLAVMHPLKRAIQHCAGPEVMTWYELAMKFLVTEEHPITKVIHPITTSEYPTPAKRPKNSVLG